MESPASSHLSTEETGTMSAPRKQIEWRNGVQQLVTMTETVNGESA